MVEILILWGSFTRASGPRPDLRHSQALNPTNSDDIYPSSVTYSSDQSLHYHSHCSIFATLYVLGGEAEDYL